MRSFRSVTRHGAGSVAASVLATGYSRAMCVAGVLTLGTAVLTLKALGPKATVIVPVPRQVAEPTAVLSPSESSTEWEMASTNAPTI